MQKLLRLGVEGVEEGEQQEQENCSYLLRLSRIGDRHESREREMRIPEQEQPPYDWNNGTYFDPV